MKVYIFYIFMVFLNIYFQTNISIFLLTNLIYKKKLMLNNRNYLIIKENYSIDLNYSEMQNFGYDILEQE